MTFVAADSDGIALRRAALAGDFARRGIRWLVVTRRRRWWTYSSKAGWVVVALTAALIGAVLRALFAVLLLLMLPANGIAKLVGLLCPIVLSRYTLGSITLAVTKAS